jgi:hypothetical protein
LAATNISATGVTLNGTVNANGLSTIVTFEIGVRAHRIGGVPISVPATQSPVTGTTLINVSADITGLISGTTRRFRVKAENSCGNTYGEYLSFTLH